MKHKPPLSVQILIGLLLGVLAGLALQAAPDVARTYIKPFGVLFLNLIKMVVVPLVFASITVGTCGLGDAKKVGRIGGKTILFYLCTTALAVTLGLLAANLFPVGRGLGQVAQESAGAAGTPCVWAGPSCSSERKACPCWRYATVWLRPCTPSPDSS